MRWAVRDDAMSGSVNYICGLGCDGGNTRSITSNLESMPFATTSVTGIYIIKITKVLESGLVSMLFLKTRSGLRLRKSWLLIRRKKQETGLIVIAYVSFGQDLYGNWKMPGVVLRPVQLQPV